VIPREITTEHWPDHTSYDFPRRPIGPWRFLGLLPMAFSILFISVPASAALHFWRELSAGKGGTMEIIFAIFICGFIVAGLVPFAVGLFVLAGRTRVVAGADRLVITEIAGPVRRSRKLRFQDIARLEVRSGSRASGGALPPGSNPIYGLGAINAVMRQGKGRLVLAGYPRDWLEPIAAELSETMRLTGADVEVKSIETLKEEPKVVSERNVPRPTASKVQMERRVNGFAMQVPPAGVRRGSRGLFFVGLFWCLVVTGICALMLKTKGAHSAQWPVWIFLGFFWFIGVVMLISAVNMGRRRATIAVESGAVKLELHSLFGSRKLAWGRGEIASVAAGPSGVTVNNVPVIELQIRPVKGKKVGILGGRADDELQWMASELSGALELGRDQEVVAGTPSGERSEDSESPNRAR
jgi:hypothetical protein